MNIRTSAIALAIACTVTCAQAQTESDSQSKQMYDQLSKLGYNMPDSPALSITGLALENTLRPQTPKELVGGIRTATDENGKLKQAINLSFVPYLTFFGNELTLKNYKDSSMRRALSNIELSAVGAKGESSQDMDRYSLGLKWNVYDEGDPKLASAGCIRRELAALVERIEADPATYPTKTEAYEKAIREAGPKALKPCYDEWTKKYWNSSAMDVGAAFGHADLKGTGTGNIDTESYGAYWTWSYPVLRESTQLIAHARYTFNEVAIDKSNGFFNQDKGFVGGRLRYSIPNADQIYFNIEAGIARTSPEGRSADQYTQFGAALEYKLTEGYWLNLSVGGKTQADNERNNTFVLGALKWNISDLFSGPK